MSIGDKVWLVTVTTEPAEETAGADTGGAMPRISCGSDRKEAPVMIRPIPVGGVMSSLAATAPAAR
jgi:hypothetical protein